MALNRPNTIWLLLVIFAWGLLKGVELVTRGNAWLDAQLLQAAGLGGVALPWFLSILALDAATVFFLVRPAPIGQIIGVAASIWSAIETTVASFLARANPHVARDAFAASREARGLPAQPEALDLVVDPTVNLVLLLASLLVTALCVFLLLRNGPYFRGIEKTPRPA
jgi:hypothetical protein